jgi:hypothetical protein
MSDNYFSKEFFEEKFSNIFEETLKGIQGNGELSTLQNYMKMGTYQSFVRCYHK